MTRDEFLSDTELVKSWKAERENNSLLKTIESIAESEAPYNKPTLSHATEADALIAYGYAQGYAARGRLYNELATLPPLRLDPTKKRSTYGIKPKEENKE